MACQAVANGFKCEKGTINISSPYDPNNPLISHVWTIDGFQESTAPSFPKTYSATGSHTVLHTGANECGSPCSQSTSLQIVDALPAAASAAPASNAALIIGGLLVLGVLGAVIMSGKKQ